MFAKPIRDHRILLSQPPYKVGPEGLRLSSLDRFPLIADDAPGKWYAPNVRCLARAVPDVIHFTLNEHCREVYERVRGHLLELYLAKLIGARAPTLTVIPEDKWPTGHGEVAGPDLVVIDHGSKPFVVGIEVKFRWMSPSTRFDLLDKDLVTNYADLWKAIRAVPDKLDKVFALVGGYSKYRDDLLRARDYPRLHLGLAGEAPFMFGELACFRGENDENFPLYGFGKSWAVMTTETFERLVEVVAQHRRSIAEVVQRYQVNCADRELSGTMAETFGNAEIDEEQSFAATFLKGGWPVGA